MYCSNCGAEVNDNAVVCVKCGCAVRPVQQTVPFNGSSKDWLVTLLLCFFVGCFGIHRFYVGKTGTGIIMLLTAIPTALLLQAQAMTLVVGVICWLLGHDHERKNFVYKGINIIYIIHGCGTSISSDPRLVRIPGTCTQNAFDVVNIDTLHRKIRVFGYGATTNCYGENGDRFLPDGLSY